MSGKKVIGLHFDRSFPVLDGWISLIGDQDQGRSFVSVRGLTYIHKTSLLTVRLQTIKICGIPISRYIV